MYCLIQFYIQLRFDLAPHRPFLKVLAIKLVIFLSFWQSFLISILTSPTLKIVNTTPKIAYPDLIVGIPCLLLCIEMSIFAVLHLFAFPYSPYCKGAPPAKFPISTPSINSGLDGPGPNQGGFLGTKALVDAMNPWDLVKGFGRGMKWLFVGRKTRENDSSYKNSAFNFGNVENENDMTLGEAGATSGGYKTDTAYNGGVGLPIANEFRRSNFGMPKTTAQDEEGAGLIAHAQPDTLNPGISTYAHPGQIYDYNGQQTRPPYPESSHEEYDYSGQDISTGGGRYGGNPTEGGNNNDYSSSRGNAPGRPTLGDPGTYRPEYQNADIGMAVSGEPQSYRSQVSSSKAYADQRQASRTRPSDQWTNSGTPTTPPTGEDDLFFGGAPAGRPGGNVI
jgi:hypothetical protein